MFAYGLDKLDQGTIPALQDILMLEQSEDCEVCLGMGSLYVGWISSMC